MTTTTAFGLGVLTGWLGAAILVGLFYLHLRRSRSRQPATTEPSAKPTSWEVWGGGCNARLYWLDENGAPAGKAAEVVCVNSQGKTYWNVYDRQGACVNSDTVPEANLEKGKNAALAALSDEVKKAIAKHTKGA